MSNLEGNQESAVDREVDARFIDERSGNEVFIVLNHALGTKTVRVSGNGYFGGDAIYEYQVPIEEELSIPDGGRISNPEIRCEIGSIDHALSPFNTDILRRIAESRGMNLDSFGDEKVRINLGM